jgi:hypothetical protein
MVVGEEAAGEVSCSGTGVTVQLDLGQAPYGSCEKKTTELAPRMDE